MEPKNNGGLKNKRPFPATLRGTERTELPPPPPPAKRLGQQRQQRDMRFWLNLTPEVRASYMAMALTFRDVRHRETYALQKAVELAKMAEMPTERDF
jgi:hypothetical protein